MDQAVETRLVVLGLPPECYIGQGRSKHDGKSPSASFVTKPKLQSETWEKTIKQVQPPASAWEDFINLSANGADSPLLMTGPQTDMSSMSNMTKQLDEQAGRAYTRLASLCSPRFALVYRCGTHILSRSSTRSSAWLSVCQAYLKKWTACSPAQPRPLVEASFKTS